MGRNASGGSDRRGRACGGVRVSARRSTASPGEMLSLLNGIATSGIAVLAPVVGILIMLRSRQVCLLPMSRWALLWTLLSLFILRGNAPAKADSRDLSRSSPAAESLVNRFSLGVGTNTTP
ncbi:hypothetical protein KCP73_12430 [Salmonella enterica subsp. enterica]|nr:hypothetical protein KCP73_12430 [Salmonella enterica subsp. enterica]